MSTKDPGTRPPPRTRSSSPIPKLRRGTSVMSTSVMRMALAAGRAMAADRPEALGPRTVRSSCIDDHALQPGQRPTHFRSV